MKKNKKAFLNLISGIILFSVFFVVSNANAAYVYVKVGGQKNACTINPPDLSCKSVVTGDDAVDWLSSNAYGNINDGVRALSQGDIMVIDDGVYKGSSNAINQGSNWIPGGISKSQMTTIKARHIPCDGVTACDSSLKVEWGNKSDTSATGPTSGLTMLGPTASTSYIKFQGIRFYNPQLYSDWHYIYFKQSAFVGSMSGDSQGLSIDSSNTLVEDSVVMGSGRYQLLSHHDPDTPAAIHNVFRRVIARKDYSNGANEVQMPMGVFSSYGTTDDAYLNCIAIDSDQPAKYASNSIEYDGSFMFGNAGRGESLLGSISYNVAMGGAVLVVNPSDPTHPSKVRDFAVVKNAGGIVMTDGNINRATIFNIGTNLFSGWRSGQLNTLQIKNDGIETGGADDLVANNTIIKTTQGWAVNTGGYGSISGSYLKVFNNTGGTFSNGATFTNSTTNVDPSLNGLLYPVRIESGSALLTGGTAVAPDTSTQIGANILKKIGHDGDFNGDSGWNIEQTENLWPWPMEDWVKAELAAMPSTLGGKTMASSTRGVAASSTDAWGQPITLTRYIWQSLGNKIPDDIYGTQVQPQTPTYSVTDLITLISSWLSQESNNASDYNSDNNVNVVDLGIMMSKWN